MKLTRFADADGGQALVIVALAMVALMGALALTLDWGQGYVLRRGMQNAVDNATLAAGRRVASTFKLVGGAPAFGATLGDVCGDVATRTAAVPGVAEIAFFSDPADPGTWTTVATSDCAAGSGVAVPSDTLFVRVRSVGSFRSLTQQAVTIAASARARLTGSAGCGGIDCTALRPLELPSSASPGYGISGYTTGPNVAIWPVVLHLDLADFQGSPCGQYCDPLTGPSRMTIWPRDSYGPAGQFRGLVTYTHFSPRESDAGSGQVHQFTTESDYTGATDGGIRRAHDHDDDVVYPPIAMPNADARACGGAGTWDTLGMSRLADASSCDLPNWFAYGFRGSVGVSTDWSGSFNGLPGGRVDRPEQLATRASCNRSVYLARPSCTGAPNQIGDWLETVPGDLDSLMAEQMRALVAKYGRVVTNSLTPVSASPGAPPLGKAVVVFVPLWDCAEHINPGRDSDDPGRWTLITPGGGDCSQLSAPGSNTVDRVHIAAIVPFTFYEGLITTSPVSVQAYWGDVFGDAGICTQDPLAASCPLNQFMNSAFLVPDE